MKHSRLILAALLVATPALAQSFAGEVDDRAVLFSPTDLAALNQQRPYRLRVLTERDPQGGAGLLERAKAAVDSPKTVVIAVDPEHRKTHVRFGAETGVKTRDYDLISAAGNGEFREKQWGPGVLHIVQQTEASMANKLTAETVSVTTVREAPTIAYIGLAGAGIALAAFLAFLWWNRRREQQFSLLLKQTGEEADRKREEANALMARNIEEERWHDQMKARIRTTSAASAPPGEKPGINVGNDYPLPATASNADWLRRNKANAMYRGQWVALNAGILVDNDPDQYALETKLASRTDRKDLLVMKLDGEGDPEKRSLVDQVVERQGTWGGRTASAPPARYPAYEPPPYSPPARSRTRAASTPSQSTTVVAIVDTPTYVPTHYSPPSYHDDSSSRSSSSSSSSSSGSSSSHSSSYSSGSSSSYDSGSSSSWSSSDSGSSSSFDSGSSGGGSSDW